jgi:citrate lyase subunit beta/citryl-CoA lyase
MTRPRRSLLFMPGSNARAQEKARNLPADGIILDLEDSVAPDTKAMAREQIAKAVAAGGFGKARGADPDQQPGYALVGRGYHHGR